MNVLIQGTTYLGMLTRGNYWLFGEHELEEHFAGWKVDYLKFESFPAPGESLKRFCALVARRP